jgi:Subtilase family
MVAGLALLTAGSTVPATATAESKTDVKTDVGLAGAGEVRLPADGVHQVTLVTGDVVTLRGLQGGKPGVTVEPAARPGGRRASFKTVTAKGDLYVMPADVAALVPAVLDREVFNVSGLVRQGYDDRRSSALPLIIRHDPKDKQVGDRLGALAAGGATVKRRLATLAAVAVRQPKARVDRLLPALREASRVAAGARTARAAAGEASARLGGVTRVLLDRKLRVAALDRNLMQVNAQAAWDAGLSGRGVKIAVLDGGVDADHPDLAGQVVAAENFTDDPDTADHFGYGTHVAGIAAGTGAAAGGDRRGVGFGAKLLNGKVCDQFGDCFLSSIAAGMEWAATQGANDPPVRAAGFLAGADPAAADPGVQGDGRHGQLGGEVVQPPLVGAGCFAGRRGDALAGDRPGTAELVQQLGDGADPDALASLGRTEALGVQPSRDGLGAVALLGGAGGPAPPAAGRS